MRNMKFMSVAFAVVLGCGASRFKETHPVSVDAGPGAFAKATRALIEQDETIDTKDESAGVIVTKWAESTNFAGDPIRQRWSVTVAGASVTVTSQCQQKISSGPLSGAPEWKDCRKGQPGNRQEKADAIAKAIADAPAPVPSTTNGSAPGAAPSTNGSATSTPNGSAS